MQFIADLHIHSYTSRATSKQLNLPHLNKWAQLKGIQIVGTGDFTHPKWLAELKEMLEPAEDGLFRLKNDFRTKTQREVFPACQAEVRFILSVEISNIYKRNGQVRKVHNVIFMPTLEAAQKFQNRLDKIGNIKSDGRPILGLDSRDLLEIVLETDPQGYLIPAHIWTPWFSVLGSKSGFDSITECYDDLSDHIFALETGLSSDPPMNWRLSQLDRYALVSNSDAHSPANLAREANLFNTEFSYSAIFQALKSRDAEKYLGTIEFFPEEGKYHLDGHRKCEMRMEPEETVKHNGLCPVCGKKVTVGVMHRVNALADRPAGKKPAGAAPFRSLIPLPEIIAEVQGVGPKSKNVQTLYLKLLDKYGSELRILRETPLEELTKTGHSLLVEAIRRVRNGEINIAAGYDGEYGTTQIFQPEEREKFLSQISFIDLDLPTPKTKKSKKKDTAAADHLFSAQKVQDEPTNPQVQLSEPQRAAVNHTRDPLLIIAGPGTGKTRTLTQRIASLVQEKQIPPAEILAITFTKHAAREMTERLQNLLSPEEVTPMTICTFHALGYQILQQNIEKLGRQANFNIYTDADRIDVLRRLLPDFSKRQLNQIADRISCAKSQLISSTQVDSQFELLFQDEFRSIYKNYEEQLQRLFAVDFDDLILLPCRLLQEFPDIQKFYQQKFKWISVDEYQDINYAQYQFLHRLLAPETNLCAIGDPNQAIYSFRGSDVKYFNQFQTDFPNARTVNLGQNFRSTEQIIKASTQVISRNPQPHKLDLWSEITGKMLVEIVTSPTEKAEAEFVVHQIEKLLGGTGFFSLDSSRVGPADEDAPRSFSDFAVLYRLRAQSAALEEAFLRSGMPYQTMGDVSFFERKPVKAILSYLKIIRNPNSDLDLLRILNTPPRGIGEKSIELLANYCEQNGLSIYEGIENQALIPEIKFQVHRAMDSLFALIRELQFEAAKRPVADVLKILLDEIGLRNFFGKTEENERLWEILLDTATSYDARFDRFLGDIQLQRETDTYDPRSERVSLMSLHASKGLEFPVVFIVGCEEGLIPYFREELHGEKLLQAEQEERRLLYVGMTRARQRLYLIHSRNRTLFGQHRRPQPSRFLNDIEKSLKRSQNGLDGSNKKKKADNQLSLF